MTALAAPHVLITLRQGMAQSWVLLTWSLHLCSAQRTCAQDFSMGEQSSDPHLKYGSGVHWTGVMLLCWACAGYRFCVAKQDFGLQRAKVHHFPLGPAADPGDH